MSSALKRQSELVSEAFGTISSPIIRNALFDLTLAIAEILKPSGAYGCMVIDLDGRILSVDDGYCEIFQRERRELMFARLDDLTHPDDRVRAALRRGHLAASQKPDVIVKRYLLPDSSAVWVRNQCFLVKDDRGPDRIVISGGTVAVPPHVRDPADRS